MGLGTELFRTTGDADVRVSPIVARNRRLVDRLEEIGYLPLAGNRLARLMTDVPVSVGSDPTSTLAVIDILVPAYTSRARSNRRISDNLVTTEVPGLATALQRAPVVLDLELHRLNG